MLQEKVIAANVVAGSAAVADRILAVTDDTDHRVVSVPWERVTVKKEKMVRNVTRMVAEEKAKTARETLKGIDEWRVWWRSSPQSRSAARMGLLPTVVVEVSRHFGV